MNPIDVDKAFPEPIPDPEIQRGNRLSIVWLIPILAALIGVWLAVKAVREIGPTITIVFESAEGLVPGKTEIKYKDVSVGKVHKIRLSPSLSQVLVTAVMSREVAAHLNLDTVFWIVRARVAAGEVTGIGTLLSGAYIGMIPGAGGRVVDRFEGWDRPPAILRDTPGRLFNLRAERLGSLDIGSPVYYRQVRVGRVTNTEMALDGTGVHLEIFVEAPHHDQVTIQSRFYNASGLNLQIGADGLRLDTPSLASLLVGGISFFTAETTQPHPRAPAGQTFTLFDNRDAAAAASLSNQEYYLVYFKESVRGLSVGAPVEFYGIRVGEVVSVGLEFDRQELSFQIPVLIAIEPDRITGIDQAPSSAASIMAQLVGKGLRVQQQTANLITGQCYLSLRMIPDAAPWFMPPGADHPVLPTIPSAVEEISASARRLMDRFDSLALEATLDDIREAARQVTQMTGSSTLERAIENIDQSFAQFKQTTADLNDATLPKMNDLLDQARRSLGRGHEVLEAAGTLLGDGAPLVYNLNRLLLELHEAARAVEALAEFLERRPEAIIFGKGRDK